MIALGLTAPGAEVPAPCLCERGSEVALVTAPDAAGPNKAALLTLRVKVHRALPVFLPFAGRPRAADAWTWVQAHPVSHALTALRGQGQITVLFRPDKRPATPGSGTDWLRARALEAQGQGQLISHLEHLAAGTPHVIGPGPDHVALHLLVPMPEMPAQESAWAARLSQPASATRGWRATLTGGWPPAAFWAPPQQERCAA